MSAATVALTWTPGAGYLVAQSFSFFRGEAVECDFTPTAVQDITGWTLQFNVAVRPGGTPILQRTTGGNGIVITNGPGGLFAVSLPNAITASASLPKGDYVWEVVRTDGGSEDVIAYGTLHVYASQFAAITSPIPPVVPPPLSVALGGTGVTTLATGLFLRGNGSAAVTTYDLFGSANVWTGSQTITTIKMPISGPVTIDSPLMDGSRPGPVLRYRRTAGEVLNVLIDDGNSFNTSGWYLIGAEKLVVASDLSCPYIVLSYGNAALAPGFGIVRLSKTTNGNEPCTIASAMLTPGTLFGDAHNYSPGPFRDLRLNSDGPVWVTGLAAGSDGQECRIHNVGLYTIMLKHESGLSSSPNRFLSVTGADLTFNAGASAGLVYDATSSRWRVWLL